MPNFRQKSEEHILLQYLADTQVTFKYISDEIGIYNIYIEKTFNKTIKLQTLYNGEYKTLVPTVYDNSKMYKYQVSINAMQGYMFFLESDETINIVLTVQKKYSSLKLAAYCKDDKVYDGKFIKGNYYKFYLTDENNNITESENIKFLVYCNDGYNNNEFWGVCGF